jgi:uncharacterized membrane protein HdeD (DUF308 family)
MTLFGFVLGVASLVCWIIILADAFRSSILKGLFGLLCGIYLLIYAILEFEHKNKWIIILVWLLGGGAGSAILRSNNVF